MKTTKPSAHASSLPAAAFPIESWLVFHRRLVIVALVTVALSLRAACFVELAASPCFWLYEWNQTDMNYFHSWALAIMEGDRWSRDVDPPLHLWHRRVAQQFAERYPQRWAAIVARYPDNPALALWRQWAGAHGTYQDPLYPYLLAGVYAALGVAAGWIYALQCFVGIGSLLLVYFITRRHFGDLAAVIAAGLTLLYAPLLFYEFTLLRATLITFFGLLIVVLLDRARWRRGMADWAVAGLVTGVAMVLKAHFMLMMPFGLLLLARTGMPRKRRMASASAFILGVAAGFAPAVVRNVVVGAPALRTAGGGAATFALSNAAHSGYVAWDYDGAAEALAEGRGRLLPTVWATLKGHSSPAGYLRLLGAKLAGVVRDLEEPNNANFYYARLYSNVLRRLPLTFGVLGPLAAVGIVLALRRRARVGPLLALIALNLIVLVGFMVFSRFRVPLAAALLPFGGLTGAELVRALGTRRWGRAAGLGVAVATPMLFTISVATAGAPRIRAVDVEKGFEVYYAVKLAQATEHRDLSAVVAILRDALAHQPAVVRALGPRRPPVGNDERQLAAFYAGLYRLAADAVEQAGLKDEAAAYRARAVELGGVPTTAPSSQAVSSSCRVGGLSGGWGASCPG